VLLLQQLHLSKIYQSANIHFTLMYQSVGQQPPYTHTIQSGGQQLPQLIGLRNTVNLKEPETSKTSVSLEIPHILESNPHTFYSFKELKKQMWITITCGLNSRSRAGFWKNDGTTIHVVRTIQYNNLLFYLLLIILYYSDYSDSPSSVITESLSMLRRDCARLLRKTLFTVLVWLIGPRHCIGF
jgi:hypothetical protein